MSRETYLFTCTHDSKQAILVVLQSFLCTGSRRIIYTFYVKHIKIIIC